MTWPSSSGSREPGILPGDIALRRWSSDDTASAVTLSLKHGCSTRIWWRRNFRENGFEIVNYEPMGLFYTGNMTFNNRLPLQKRAMLAKWLGSACHLFEIRLRYADGEAVHQEHLSIRRGDDRIMLDGEQRREFCP